MQSKSAISICFTVFQTPFFVWLGTVYYYAYIVGITWNTLIHGYQFSKLHRRGYFYNLSINYAYGQVRLCECGIVYLNVITWSIIRGVRSWTAFIIIVYAIADWLNRRKRLEKLLQELFWIIRSWQLCLPGVVYTSCESLD